MIKIKFSGMEGEVPEEEYYQGSFVADFDSGNMKVLFFYGNDGHLRALAAVDPWGNSCYEAIKDCVPKVITEPLSAARAKQLIDAT